MKNAFEKQYDNINKNYAERLLKIDENLDNYLDKHVNIGGVIKTIENHSFDIEMTNAKSIRNSELLNLNTKMLLKLQEH